MDRARFDDTGYKEGHYLFCDNEDEDDAKWYISCNALLVGDYVGAGSVGEANIRALTDPKSSDYVKDHIESHGGYYSRQVWLPDTEENRDLIEGLERDYPVIDEELVSEVEMEWENELWLNDLRQELVRTVGKEISWALEETLDAMASHERWGLMLWECYRSAMAAENEYPVFEYNGCYVDADRIYARYAEFVIELLQDVITAMPFQLAHWGTDPVESDILADWIEDNYREDDKDILIQYLKNSAQEMRERAEEATATATATATESTTK